MILESTRDSARNTVSWRGSPRVSVSLLQYCWEVWVLRPESVLVQPYPQSFSNTLTASPRCPRCFVLLANAVPDLEL